MLLLTNTDKIFDLANRLSKTSWVLILILSFPYSIFGLNFQIIVIVCLNRSAFLFAFLPDHSGSVGFDSSVCAEPSIQDVDTIYAFIAL